MCDDKIGKVAIGKMFMKLTCRNPQPVKLFTLPGEAKSTRNQKLIEQN